MTQRLGDPLLCGKSSFTYRCLSTKHARRFGATGVVNSAFLPTSSLAKIEIITTTERLRRSYSPIRFHPLEVVE